MTRVRSTDILQERELEHLVNQDNKGTRIPQK
jgi:hypothetical protein